MTFYTYQKKKKCIAYTRQADHSQINIDNSSRSSPRKTTIGVLLKALNLGYDKSSSCLESNPNCINGAHKGANASGCPSQTR